MEAGRESAVAEFERFVRCNSAALLRTLSFVALDKETAADACQDAFIQLYLKWEKVSAYDDPVAWLYRVGINRCRDVQRKLSRRNRVMRRLEVQVRQAPFAYDWLPDSELMSVLSRLPPRQRATVVLFYLEDLSIAQISALMKISEGAVNSHLHKARKTLRTVLEAG
jgi:RNA polymerase sigma-70 factor (ECF subfamily)